MRRWLAATVRVSLLTLLAVPAGAAPKSAAPRVRIAPIAAFDSMPIRLAQPGSWSPRGTRLVLQRELNQLWVLDASQPERRPRRVYDTTDWIRWYGWSPDGEWLLLISGDPSERNDRMLIAVPAGGGRPDTLRAEQDIVEAFWGSDGRVHYRVQYDWHDLPPPERWKPAAWFVPRPVPWITGEKLMLTLGPRAGAYDQPAHLGTFKHDTRMIVMLDALPDGSRWLLRMSHDTTGAVRLVDGRGKTLLDVLRLRHSPQPTAIDADTQLIVGYSGDGGGGEQGWTHTWLEAADGGGRWTAKIAGGDGGSDPQMSREGSFIAWGTAAGTRVGQLVVEQ
ncbi:MAG TPA: hypothetical protein VJY35_04210 [Candidatus Eisenbacteria bacterium]|nr:hypothetical protein [Candidatus Eisenbacteria bacterium]